MKSLGQRMETFHDANNPKFMYHATKPPVQVFSRRDIEELGPEWSETLIPREYPKCKYHWNGKTVTVKSPDEERNLGGGWASSPSAFEAYRDPARSRPKEPDPLKWVDQWLTPQSPELQRRIKLDGIASCRCQPVAIWAQSQGRNCFRIAKRVSEMTSLHLPDFDCVVCAP